MLLNTKEDWQPEQADIIQWSRAYPAVNVDQELMAMESWLDANPTKRKTKAGIKRFVNSWLSRAQNQGGSSPIAKSYKKADSIRARTLDESLTDITWLPPEQQQEMKEYYLAQRGFYFDGELRHGSR
jgi:hypothetical protein